MPCSLANLAAMVFGKPDTEFRRELNESEVGQGPGMGCMTELGSRQGLHD